AVRARAGGAGMNPREKKLAIVILTAVGLGAGYQVVNYALIKPFQQKKAEVAKLEKEEASRTILQDKQELAQRWKDLAMRTISYDSNETRSYLTDLMATMVRKHGLDMEPLRPGIGAGIGTKTDIRSIEFRLSATGDYRDVVAFL